VPTGEMGTLRIKGDSAALCYWQAHEKSKETFAGDWCTTGDQFHVDGEGYYWYHGRTDDMLKVSGVYVAPAEIENCLLQHEAVLECAVVGHDAGDHLIKPKAFVVPRAMRSWPRRSRSSSNPESPSINTRAGSSSSRRSPRMIAARLIAKNSERP
jgi:acyl-coenzyme A synthetase/AMP-(fatty) acid ligase